MTIQTKQYAHGLSSSLILVFSYGALLGCNGPSVGGTRLLVTNVDFGPPARLEAHTVDLATLAVARSNEALTGTDTIPAFMGTTPALLERASGTLRVMSPSNPLVTVRTIDLTPSGVAPGTPYGSNPLDAIEVPSGLVWVPLAGKSAVLRIDPDVDDASAQRVGELDLSQFQLATDTDGNVDVVSAALVGARLYLGLGRYFFDAMGTQQFTGPSLIVAIDTGSNTIVDADAAMPGVQATELAFRNPWRGIVLHGGKLLVGATGSYTERDGAIEGIDLSTNRSTGAELTEQQLGAELEGFASLGGDRVIVQGGGALRIWHPSTDALDAPFVASGASDFEVAGDRIYVAVGMTVRVFTTAQTPTEVTGSPVTVGTAPIYGLAVAR